MLNIRIKTIFFFLTMSNGNSSMGGHSACQACIAPFDVRLPVANEADEEIKTVIQADILVVCNKSKLDEKGCRGAPDLVVEVLSPNSSPPAVYAADDTISPSLFADCIIPLADDFHW